MSNEVRDPDKMSVRELVAALTIGHVRAVIVALAGLVVGAVSLGWWTRGMQDTIELFETRQVEFISTVFRSIKGQEFGTPAADPRLAIVSTAPNRTTVFVQLAEVPIKESVRLQIGSSSASYDSFEQHRNVLMVAVFGNVERTKQWLERDAISVFYVGDSSVGAESVRKLWRDGDKVYAGETMLYDGARTLWPSGGNGPYDRNEPGREPPPSTVPWRAR